MSEKDTAQAVSPEEDARIGATPATFDNKLYITMMAGGAKITFAEAQRAAGKDEVWPRVPVFLQRTVLAALHRLLGAAVNAATAAQDGGRTSARGGSRTPAIGYRPAAGR